MAHGTLVVPHGTLSGECKYSMGIYSLFRQLSMSFFLIVTRRGLLTRANAPGQLRVPPWAFTTILTKGRLFGTPWDTEFWYTRYGDFLKTKNNNMYNIKTFILIKFNVKQLTSAIKKNSN